MRDSIGSTGLEFVGHWSQRRDLRSKERTMATHCQNEDPDLYSTKAGRLLLGKSYRDINLKASLEYREVANMIHFIDS